MLSNCSDNLIRSEVSEDMVGDGSALKWNDKVKLMRTRTCLNDLQAVVTEKEFIITCRRFVSNKKSHVSQLFGVL